MKRNYKKMVDRLCGKEYMRIIGNKGKLDSGMSHKMV